MANEVEHLLEAQLDEAIQYALKNGAKPSEVAEILVSKAESVEDAEYRSLPWQH